MIPQNISKEAVLSSLEEIKKNGIPESRHSDKYFLLHDNFLYPPKYVLTIANKFVNSKELDSTEFSGGSESNEFLEKLGFTLVRKPSDLPGQKWLAVVTPENWEICLQKRTFGGDDNRANQIKRIKSGDHVLIYLAGMKIAAICKVVKEYFYDENKIVNDGIYPHRIGIEPIKKPKSPLDVRRIYDTYFTYKGKSAGYFGQTIRNVALDESKVIAPSDIRKRLQQDLQALQASDMSRMLGSLIEMNVFLKAKKIRKKRGRRASSGHEPGPGVKSYYQQTRYFEIIKKIISDKYARALIFFYLGQSKLIHRFLYHILRLIMYILRFDRDAFNTINKTIYLKEVKIDFKEIHERLHGIDDKSVGVIINSLAVKKTNELARQIKDDDPVLSILFLFGGLYFYFN